MNNRIKNTNKKFKTGDIVILCSDLEQTPMTIRGYVEDMKGSIFLPKDQVEGFVICDWRDTQSKPHQRQYNQDELKLI